MVYESNIDNITNVKTHWNRRVLEAKIEPTYKHKEQKNVEQSNVNEEQIR